MKVLLTGGAGFIGSHIAEHLAINTDWDILILDRLNYAGSLDRLAHLKDRVRFHYHDIRAQWSKQLIHRLGNVDCIIHAAAETHVENSILDPQTTVETNVLGTFHTLQAAVQMEVEKFVQVGTDEVFGPAPMGTDYRENDRFHPSNPYSAAKAGADCLAMAWAKCYGLPMILTRTMNNFGERQHPEKFIPMAIRHIVNGEMLPIHAVGDVIGSRKWLHARNHADAILHLIQNKQTGSFHIGGEEHDNLEMAQLIAEIIGKKLDYRIIDYHSTRPGHDLRYSLDDSKLRKQWNPPVDFMDSLRKTVEWSTRNMEWLEGRTRLKWVNQ